MALYLARRARTVRPDTGRRGRAFVAASAGVVFGRSQLLVAEVHQAMVARGYRGEVPALDPPAPGRRDVVALAAVAVDGGGLRSSVLFGG